MVSKVPNYNAVAVDRRHNPNLLLRTVVISPLPRTRIILGFGEMNRWREQFTNMFQKRLKTNALAN